MKGDIVKCYVGNLDGTREGLIVASSQKEAATIAKTTLYDFRNYWHATVNPWPIKSPKPRTLYTRMFNSNGEWVEGNAKQ